MRAALIVLCIVLLASVVQAQSLTFFEDFVPDESGPLLVLVGSGSGHTDYSGSYGILRVQNTEGFLTLIGPKRFGVGLDAGKVDGNARVGGCWIDTETWGLYIRGGF